MPLIDDDGNLFGAVNVIDVLVLLVLIAVGVAGAAVVTDEFPLEVVIAAVVLLTVTVVVITLFGAWRSTDAARRYATIELEPQPDYVLERIEEGDVGTLDDTDEPVEVTDVRVTPASSAEGARPDITLRTEVVGDPLPNDAHGRDRFLVDDADFRLGDEVRLNMGPYAVTGTVTDLDHEGATLSEAETTTTAELRVENVPPTVANGLEAGMTETNRGDTLASLESVEREPARVVLESEDGNIYEREHPQRSDLTLVAELQTTEGNPGVRFRGQRLRVGSSVVLDFNPITVDATVSRIECSR